MSLTRFNKRQLHRVDIPASSAEEYFYKVIYIPLLDHLIMEI